MAPTGQAKSLTSYTLGLKKDKTDVWTIASAEENPLFQPQPLNELFIEAGQQNQRNHRIAGVGMELWRWLSRNCQLKQVPYSKQ